MPICNRCAIEEPDDSDVNWIAGKQVGYCIDCHQQMVLDLPEDVSGHNRSATSKPKGRKRQHEETAGVTTSNNY